MTNGRNRHRIFLSMLIVDTIAVLLKLAFALWWLTAIVQEKQRYDRRPVHYESDYLSDFVRFFAYCGCGGLLFWILLKLAANYQQYRQENLKNISNRCCFGTCCWFFYGIVLLIYTVIFIFVNWCRLTDDRDCIDESCSTCQWPRHAAMGFLFWETFMFGVMVVHRINKRERPSHSESET